MNRWLYHRMTTGIYAVGVSCPLWKALVVILVSRNCHLFTDACLVFPKRQIKHRGVKNQGFIKVSPWWFNIINISNNIITISMSCPVKIQRFKAAVLSVSLLAFAIFFLLKGQEKENQKTFLFLGFFFRTSLHATVKKINKTKKSLKSQLPL